MPRDIICYTQFMSQSKNKKTRFHLIDELRGVAVLLMVVFHFAYDLMVFGHVQIDFQKDLLWFALPRVIVFLFLFCVGVSLYLVHSEKILWPRFWKRWGLLATYAVIVSISTYYMFPQRWIYWGTLHCIAFCSLAALPFLKFPKLALAIGVPMLVLALFFKINIPWLLLPHRSMDYIPPFPWLGVAFLGIFVASKGWHQVSLPEIPYISRPLRFMGRHALIIYVVHQPLMFSLFKAYSL